MKLATTKPVVAEPTPEPAANPANPTQTNDNQPSSDEKPFDGVPFDAGVEADEQSDPKKFIEQLTGKLGQSLRKYTETQGQPDFELEKFAINSLLSATHTSEMDSNDQNDIIKKIKTAGNNDNSENPNGDDKNNDSNSGGDDANGSTNSDGDDLDSNGDDNDQDLAGLNEKEEFFLSNPKKNNMFQPNSNDILDGTELGNVKKESKQLNVSEKSSIFDKIKSKLHETFNQDDDMSEPVIEPIVKPAPTTTPEKPTIAPSRKNKPFLPMPDVQPDPKAKK